MPPLRRALDAFRDVEGLTARDVRWLWLACRLAQDLWDDELWYVLATRGLRVARETGALSVLPIAATYRASLHVHAGEFGAASALIEEADAITQATGMAPLKYASLMLAAWRGNEAEGLELIEAGRLEATARGEGMGLGVLEWATALLYNGRGRYAEALAAAQRGCEHDDVGLFAWSLVELIEAGVRSGATDATSAALDRLSERTQASGTDWALGIEAGSRALLSDGRDAEPLYREAVERLARSRGVVHLARARLLYGEWLRRENRRVDAREQLRAAHEMFSGIGAEAFAERARRELLATGETARRRTDDDARRAHAPGGTDRSARQRRSLEPGDRRTAVHQPAHGRSTTCARSSRSSTSPRATSSAAFRPASSTPPSGLATQAGVLADARAPRLRDPRCMTHPPHTRKVVET